MQVNILEARNRLSQLIKAARAGEEVVIANRGEPVARLVPAIITGAAAVTAGASVKAVASAGTVSLDAREPAVKPYHAPVERATALPTIAPPTIAPLTTTPPGITPPSIPGGPLKWLRENPLPAYARRSAAEIDAGIEAERNSWD